MKEIIEKLKRDIVGFEDKAEFAEIGIVTEVGDGIAKISGLRNALSQEILSVETASGVLPAVAFNLEENSIGAIILGEAHGVSVGNRVKKSGKILSLKTGDELLGRVIDPLGEPQDGKGVIFSAKGGFLPTGQAGASGGKDYPLERKAPSVLDRESVSAPVHTGIKSIDAMIPIGRGQRELIIGDRQTGKTAIALDTILNQKQDALGSGRKQVICIYVAVGQKNSKIAKIVRMLEENEAIKYTVVVSAPASSPASLQFLAPFAGCAIGEYFMDSGRDALIVYDDLSKHADSYRQLSLLLRRPPGREAYPGDIFYLHARLLERAAKLSKTNGGGSLTALPIIETKLGDVSAYIPTNVISITDGQIYLESNLFYQGVRPAINAGLSVSRVGSAAQTKAMKKVSGKLRLELAQFRELQAFVQFASDLDENTRNQIKRGELLTEVLKQSDGEPAAVAMEVASIFAAINGFLDDIPKKDIKTFDKEFLEFISKMHQTDIIEPLSKGEWNEKTEENLRSAIQSFKNMKKIS